MLLDGVQRGCDAESPAEVRAIKDDIARIDAAAAKATAAAYDFSWLIAEAKKNPDQQFVLDPRFGVMLTTIVPDVQLEYESLSGCEPHNCDNRGFIWIDTAAKQSVVMTGGILASKTTDPSRIPAVFWKQTERRWARGQMKRSISSARQASRRL